MTFSLPAYLEELASFVNIDTGTYSLEGNKELANIFQVKFQELGFDVKFIDCGPAGVGIEARNKPKADTIDIMLIGHFDTVFPVGTASQRPLTFDDKRAYGPGVADMKAGILNIFYALRGLDKDSFEKLSIAVCLNPDEETGSNHSTEWLTEVALKSKKVILAEPGRPNNAFVNARKGIAIYSIEFHGRAAHAGNDPKNGRSAVTEMCHWILAFNKMSNEESGLTFNAGKVSGGTASNVIPKYAEMLLDVRFWCNEEYEKVHEQILSMLEKTFTEGIVVKLERISTKGALSVTEESKKLMALVEECAKEIPLEVEWMAVGGISDGNTTGKLGIPTVDAFGPSGGNLHNDDEYLELDSIEPRIELLKKVLQRIAA